MVRRGLCQRSWVKGPQPEGGAVGFAGDSLEEPGRPCRINDGGQIAAPAAHQNEPPVADRFDSRPRPGNRPWVRDV